jgi:hypothetical protein
MLRAMIVQNWSAGRLGMSDNSALKKISNGNRAYGWSVIVAVALAVPLLTVPLLPFAYLTRDNLRETYSLKGAQMVSYHSTRTSSCGTYQVQGSGTKWKYVQKGGHIWAEGEISDWRNLGDGSKSGQIWADCMNQPEGKGAAFGWISEAIIVLILRVT